MIVELDFTVVKDRVTGIMQYVRLVQPNLMISGFATCRSKLQALGIYIICCF